jgi:hypothetical protein
MIEAKPTMESVAEALSAAVPTLDPAEQRLALQLYMMMLVGKPVTTADLAVSAGMQARLVEAALGRWPGVAWRSAACPIRSRPRRARSRPGLRSTSCSSRRW